MWTKNFENLVNGYIYSSKWNSNKNNGETDGGNHRETPYSIKDTDGIIENLPFSNTNSGNSTKCCTIPFLTYLDSTVGIKEWRIKNFLSSGEESAKLNYDEYSICFGSGTSPESREDYTVDCISGITSVSPTMQAMAILNEQNNNYDLTISSAIQCPNACTINEIGIHKLVPKYELYTSSYNEPRPAVYPQYWCNVLLYRKVLDTPIVLQPNEPATVTFQISLPRITLA